MNGERDVFGDDAHFISQRSDYSEDLLRMRYQIELVNQLGNLLSRCLSPALHAERNASAPKTAIELLDSDRKLLEQLSQAPGRPWQFVK